MRRNGEKTKELQFLAEEFENFYNRTYEIAGGNLKTVTTPPKKMLQRLNLTKEEYHNIYIAPYAQLTKKELETTFKILASELRPLYVKENITPKCTLRLSFDKNIERRLNALDWLLFQVDELCLFDMSDEMSEKINIPKKQCFYCGQPNFYEKEINGKIKQINFNGRGRFCHKSNCQKGSNPEKHADDCCFGKWERAKKTLEQKLDRACGGFYTVKDELEAGELSTGEVMTITQEAREIFTAFCLKQYLENLKINHTIQSKLVPALNLTDFSL